MARDTTPCTDCDHDADEHHEKGCWGGAPDWCACSQFAQEEPTDG